MRPMVAYVSLSEASESLFKASGGLYKASERVSETFEGLSEASKGPVGWGTEIGDMGYERFALYGSKGHHPGPLPIKGTIYHRLKHFHLVI